VLFTKVALTKASCKINFDCMEFHLQEIGASSGANQSEHTPGVNIALGFLDPATVAHKTAFEAGAISTLENPNTSMFL
jgi:hypothetical protein